MPQGYDYEDIGGGVNRGAAPAAIDKRQMAALANFYPFETRLRRRGGVRKITNTTWHGQQIVSMFPLKKSDGTWVLIVGGQTKFGRLDADTIVDIPFNGGGVSTSARPWNFFQYKDYLYGLREGQLFRISEDVAVRAGLSAPLTAPVIAQGAVGALAAGNYRAVVAFVNRATGYVSDYSPESNILALGAGRKIDYSSVPTSADPFIDARWLYRTLLDQTGVYFFVAEISDNTTTTFTGDEVLPQNLGDDANPNLGSPPTGLSWGAIFQERNFVTDGVDIFYSEFLQAEGFAGDSVISVYKDDGHVIRGLLAFGDRLIIGKTNKIHYLVGNTRTNFTLRTLSDVHGLMSGYSLQSAEGQLFWYGSGKTVYRSDGVNVKDISSPQVKDLLDAIPDDREEFVIGAVFPALNWYVLSIPQEGFETNRSVLVYNYKYNTWTVFTHPSDAPQFIGNFFNENYGHILYSTFYDGHLYQYNDETYETDFGNTITASLTTKSDDFGAPGYRKSFSEIWLLAPAVAGNNLRLEVLRDELSTPITDRMVSLNIANSSWKAYRLPTWTTPGTKLQARITYTGAPMIDIDQLHFEVSALKRKPRQPV